MAGDPPDPDELPVDPYDLSGASDAALAEAVAAAWDADGYRTTTKEHGSHVFVFAKEQVDGAVRGEIVWVACERSVESSHLRQLEALAEKTGAASAVCLTVGSGEVAASAAATHEVSSLDGDDLRRKLGLDDVTESDTDETDVAADPMSDLAEPSDRLDGLSAPDEAEGSDAEDGLSPPGDTGTPDGSSAADGLDTGSTDTGEADVGSNAGGIDIGSSSGDTGSGNEGLDIGSGSGVGPGDDDGIGDGTHGTGRDGGGGENGFLGDSAAGGSVGESDDTAGPGRSSTARRRLDAWDGQTDDSDVGRPPFDGVWAAVTRGNAVESILDLDLWDEPSR